MPTNGGGIRLLRTDGTPVLESVASATVHGGVPYAAFGFSTATEPELVPPSFDTGVLPPAPPDSARHRATGILSQRVTSNGFTAELSTDDPEGRTMTLTAAETDGAFRLDVSVSQPRDVTAVFAAFQSPIDEAFHGFGGRRESTNLRGTMIANWVFDYRFPNLDTAYYYPQPLFLSSKGYAAWVQTDSMATFRMASDVSDAFRISVADQELRLVLVPERGVTALARVTALTGRHRVAPRFSLGPTLSRTIQIGADTPDVYRAKVTDDLSHITNGDLLVEAYAYEGWAQLPSAFVTATNATLTASGIHPLLYVRSFVANDVAGTEPAGRFDEAIQKGYVAMHADGTPYTFPGPFGTTSAVVDFTNPAAKAWWKEIVTRMLDTGADGFMCDFGEQVLPDMVFADGSTGATMHNRYPILQHAAAREVADEFTTVHPGRDIFFFVRAGYAGLPGSAAYEGATFPGDESSDWKPSTGLPSIVPDMLNRSIFGAYGFTTDIGGYADFDGVGGDEELFVRWMEAAVFTTHFRVHNSPLTGVRMPWTYGADTEATWKTMAALHNRVRPLILRLWEEAETSGVPPVRPVWLENDVPAARDHGDDEWMVGGDVLVAPALARGATTRDVWFPKGCWQFHGDGATYEGPSTETVDAPLRTVLWFTRCGRTPF